MQSLYIHIPFCQKKCFYCSFVVSVGQEHQIDEYIDGLENEALNYRNTEIDTIYFGGGTPSYLNNAQLQRLINFIFKIFNINKNCECTIEINPEAFDLKKAKLLKSLGINRVSLGVQSFNDQVLKYLGRCHDSKTAINAYDVLRKAGFNNISIDLMYSFPNQTLSQIEQDVKAVTKLQCEHISLYSLMIEENSRFYTQKVHLNNDDQSAEYFKFVIGSLETNNFHQYEISNFAKPKKESIHNLNYWQGGDYIGLGIGAHSHQEGKRAWNVSKLSDYFMRIKNNESPIDGSETLLVCHANKNLSPKKRKLFLQYFTKPKKTYKDLVAVRKIFIEGGSLQYSLDGIKSRLVKSEKIFENLKMNPTYKKIIQNSFFNLFNHSGKIAQQYKQNY